MAQTVRTVFSCDLDGIENDKVETVTFGNDGVTYEIELCPEHVAEYQAWVGEYVAKARRIKGGRSRPYRSVQANPRKITPKTGGLSVVKPKGAVASNGKPSASEMRAWATGNGYKVGQKGRIPADIQDAYRAAQKQTA